MISKILAGREMIGGLRGTHMEADVRIGENDTDLQIGQEATATKRKIRANWERKL